MFKQGLEEQHLEVRKKARTVNPSPRRARRACGACREGVGVVCVREAHTRVLRVGLWRAS